MKVTYDFNLNLWIKDIEVEGKDKEDCYNNFCKLSLQELLDKGLVKDMEVTNLDEEVIAEEETYKVFNIEWESDAPEDLPTEGEITINVENDSDIEDLLSEGIMEKLGGKDYWWPILFDYKKI